MERPRFRPEEKTDNEKATAEREAPIMAYLINVVRGDIHKNPEVRLQIYRRIIGGCKTTAKLNETRDIFGGYSDDDLQNNILRINQILGEIAEYYEQNHADEIRDHGGEINEKIRKQAIDHFTRMQDGERPTNRPPSPSLVELEEIAAGLQARASDSGVQIMRLVAPTGLQAFTDLADDGEEAAPLTVQSATAVLKAPLIVPVNPRERTTLVRKVTGVIEIPEAMRHQNELRNALTEALDLAAKYKKTLLVSQEVSEIQTRCVALGIKTTGRADVVASTIDEIKKEIEKKQSFPRNILLSISHAFSAQKKIDFTMLVDDVKTCDKKINGELKDAAQDVDGLRGKLGASFTKVEVAIQKLLDRNIQPDGDTMQLIQLFRQEKAAFAA